MGLEVGTHISDLIATNPTGEDYRSTSDDHQRLIKACVKNSLPNSVAASTPNAVAVSGTNTYTVSLSPAPSAYAAYMFVRGSFTNANTGAATLNVNSLGAKAIQKDGSALVAGDIGAADIVGLMYDGTQFQIIEHSKVIGDALAGTLVTEDGTQTLTNKTISGGTLSLIGKFSLAWQHKDASFAAVAGTPYVLDMNTAGQTATLPASPADNDSILFAMDGSGVENWTISGNGNNLRGNNSTDTSLTVDIASGGFWLRWHDADSVWEIL